MKKFLLLGFLFLIFGLSSAQAITDVTPANSVLNPANETVYAVNNSTPKITPYKRTASGWNSAGMTTLSLPAGSACYGMAVSADGTKLYYGVNNGASSAVKVQALDAATGNPTGNPTDMTGATWSSSSSPAGMTLIGNRLLLADKGLGRVRVFNTATNIWVKDITDQLAGKSNLYDLAAYSTGANTYRVYLSRKTSAGEIYVFTYNTSTDTAAYVKTLTPGLSYPTYLKVVGNRLYVANNGTDGVDIKVYSTADESSIGDVKSGVVGSYGWTGFAVSRDGSYLFFKKASNSGETTNYLYRINTSNISGTVNATSVVAVNKGDGMVVSRNYAYAAITNSPDGGFYVAGTGVSSPSPTITSVNPTSGAQGWTGNVVITGTNFQDGATAAFGSGITVNSTTFGSATQLTANISIASGATVGARNVTVTNPDLGTVTGNSLFTVTAVPTITSVSPNSKGQGWTGDVTIGGTNFQPGATASFSGAGITVNSHTTQSTTQVKINITIAPDAAAGARNVTVINPDGGTATGNNLFTVTASPTITNVNPNSGGQGAVNKDIVVTGTNFVSGAAVSFSGSGITGPTTFNSATQLTVKITIGAGAATGARDVIVTNLDGGTVTATGAFTVNAAPTITNVNPNTGGQGAVNKDIVVTGNNFVSGAAVSFSGTGITVNSTTFNSATQLTANISIAAGATTGARDVTVTNPDGGTKTITNYFTVTIAPTATSINPNSGGQGWIGDVTIGGTGFQPGATASFSGSGITVNSHTTQSATQLKINITIAADAAPGARNVTVINPDGGTATGITFTVNASPTITNVNPNAGGQGAVNKDIVVTGTNFVSGAAVSFSGSGITGPTTFNSATQLTANISIDLGAATGARDVIVTNPDGGKVTATGAFTVNAAPTITNINPSTGGQGAVNKDIVVTGANFVSGAAVSFSGTGITVHSTTFGSATQLTANISIASDATVGTRNVTVTNPDGGTKTVNNYFTVTAAPTATSINPDSGGQNWTGDVTISGTGFQAGTTADFGDPKITVNTHTTRSATQLKINITIAADTTPGAKNVTVINPDGGTATGLSFTVTASPTITNVNPNAGGQGAVDKDIVVTGTNFVSGATVSFSGSGISGPTTFNSATQLTVKITIGAGAATGARDVIVTNPDGGKVTATGAFTVNAAPTITNINPSTGGQGAVNKDIIVTGTGFVSGAAVSFSGAGITSLTTFNSATQLTVNISIAAGAATGARDVTVTNPDGGTKTITNYFTVNAAPTVTSANPNNGGQGWTGDVTIGGTGFQSGANASFSGSGITVNSHSTQRTTQLKINVTIDLAAAAGARNVTVINPDGGTGTGNNLFTVTAAPAPTVTSIDPNNGVQGQTVTVINLIGTGFSNGASVKLTQGASTINATNVAVASATHITCAIPIGATDPIGKWDVVVTNLDTQFGTLTQGFTVYAPGTAPTVTGIEPNVGQRGTTVNITNLAGTNFAAGATVKLARTGQADIPAVGGSVVVVGPNQITCSFNLATAQVGLWSVMVTNTDGQTGMLYNGFSVVTDPATMPTVTNIYPKRAPNANPTSIKIIGTSFTGATAVDIQTQPSRSLTYTVDSATMISATVPADLPPAAYHITVTNASGPSAQTAADTFEVMSAPDATPSQVKDFTASDGEDQKSTLRWTNPTDNDMATLEVRRYAGAFPADHTTGGYTTVYTAIPAPGTAVSTVDAGLSNGTACYYVVFIRDTSDNWSAVNVGQNAATGTPQVGGTGQTTFDITYLSNDRAENWISVPFDSAQSSGSNITTLGNIMDSVCALIDSPQEQDLLTLGWRDNATQDPQIAQREFAGGTWVPYDPAKEALPIPTGSMFSITLANPNARAEIHKQWTVSGNIPASGSVTFAIVYQSNDKAENWISIPNISGMTTKAQLLDSICAKIDAPQEQDLLTLGWRDNASQDPQIAQREFAGGTWVPYDPAKEAQSINLGEPYVITIANPNARGGINKQWP